jgi:formylglycine-generating enzyme required for sulfatase activity
MSVASDRAGLESMVLVPGGTFRMGSEQHYPEERPVVEATVGDVLFDRHPVTNADFAAFVEATGHRTVAELAPDPADFPGADPALLVPGSQVFTPTSGPVQLVDWTRWWRWQPGASWRSPEGPGSDYRDRLDHPVVHVGWEDALAYARWAGKDLPTEEEWEHAARGGLDGREFAWGDELRPDGAVLANTWQGRFPWRSDDPDGWDRTSPVGSYLPNGYGLEDMIGNVWEWTSTAWTPSHARRSASPAVEPVSSCCGSVRAVPSVRESDRMVIKGGSHLCSPDYCRRYRPAARQGHGVRDTTSHVGFRCVSRG